MIVVSHRGPVSFTQEPDGTFTARRGAGGVVSALLPLLRGRTGARWLAAAIGADDRAAVAAGAVDLPDVDVELLALDAETHRLHYDVMSNRVLWFCFHGLLGTDIAVPDVDELAEAWDAYRSVNRTFADHIAATATADDIVLVQDLHFLLVGPMLRELRPDLALAHFTHTPFARADELGRLPDAMAREILNALAAVPAGFHSPRWVDALRASCDAYGIDPGAPFTTTFAPDEDELAAVAGSDAAQSARAALTAQLGDRKLLVRVDRIELSKNIVRGFAAYEHLLRTREPWRGRVTFVAMLNPSRETLPEYRAYRAEVERMAASINAEFGTAGWDPVLLDLRDDFPLSIAALQLADVLVVNPVRDGLNLVAMEGPLVNGPTGALCLSTEAGAFDLLRADCVAVDPFSVEQTADAMHEALELDEASRRAHHDHLVAAIRAHPASRWLDELVSRAAPAG